jgi:hypothetical protein
MDSPVAAGPPSPTLPAPEPIPEPDFGGGFDDDDLHEEPGSADAGAVEPEFGDAGVSPSPVEDAGSPSDNDASD